MIDSGTINSVNISSREEDLWTLSFVWSLAVCSHNHGEHEGG